MHNNEKIASENNFFLTLIIPYFYLIDDLSIVPLYNITCTQEEMDNLDLTSPHTKVFGTVPLTAEVNYTSRSKATNEKEFNVRVKPAKGYMWISTIMRILRGIIIISLSLGLVLHCAYPIERPENAFLLVLVGLVVGVCAFTRISMSYSFFEVVMVILFSINCIFQSEERIEMSPVSG